MDSEPNLEVVMQLPENVCKVTKSGELIIYRATTRTGYEKRYYANSAAVAARRIRIGRTPILFDETKALCEDTREFFESLKKYRGYSPTKRG